MKSARNALSKFLAAGFTFTCISPLVLSQHRAHARPLPGPVKDAGVYHLATDTWTRAGNHENLGPKVLYCNTASTGFFGGMGIAADLVWTDEGRIPSSGGHPNAKSDSYLVNGFSFAYCSSVAGNPQQGSVLFYECYAGCTDPQSLSAVASFPFTVPGGGSTSACWIAAFDLTGTLLEFQLSGDCDGTFHGTSALDNFGWTLILEDQGSGGFNGPTLTGDPNNFAYGDGTYYQSSGAYAGTGLGTVDFFGSATRRASIRTAATGSAAPSTGTPSRASR